MCNLIKILSILLLMSTTILPQIQRQAPVISEEPEANITSTATPSENVTYNNLYIVVDEMQNAYSAANGSINPLAVDPWSKSVAVVHRGASSYGFGSGQLFYNYSTDIGSSWTRVLAPINYNPIQARYPSMAINNQTRGDIDATTCVFSWPEIGQGTAINVGFGADAPLGAGSPFSDTLIGTVSYDLTVPCWTNDNSDYFFWAAGNTENAGITLFRTTDFSEIKQSNPPQWSSAAFQHIGHIQMGGFAENNVQYFAVLGTFPDPNPSNPIKSGWYPGVSKSTDFGLTWSNWDIIDFRQIPALSVYDRLWDWKKDDTTVSYQGDIIVDNNGFVHLIIGVTDTTINGNTGNNAIVELYQTSSGWEGKVIAELGSNSDLTDWTYDILDQNGYSAFLSRSADGNTITAQWASGSGPGNLVDLFYSSRSTAGGAWIEPVNITNTPGRSESISHMAPYMITNADGEHTFFSMFVYNKSGIVPPDATLPTNIFIAPVEVYLDTLPRLKLVSPNGGENWLSGSVHNINWISSFVNDVKLEYSTDSGSSWIIITDSIPSTGNYSWLVPEVTSSHCRVKVSALQPDTLADISNGDFTIGGAIINLVRPTNREYWFSGETKPIIWSASPNITNISIDLSTDGGSSWSIIAPSVPSTGSYINTYNWLVPEVHSDLCKIRVSASTNPAITDMSDSNFSIVNLKPVIIADSIWIDSDYNGSASGVVDGSQSQVVPGMVTFKWYVNNILVSEGITPSIQLKTGRNTVRLLISMQGKNSAVDKIIDVYASRVATGTLITGGMSEHGGYVYYTANNGLYKIDSTGALIKSFLKNGGFTKDIIINERVNLLFTADTDTIYCFNTDLDFLWSTYSGGKVSALTVDSQGFILYALVNHKTTIDGFLKSYSTLDGSLNWSFTTGDRMVTPPVIIEVTNLNNIKLNTYIYYRMQQGTVYAIEDLGSTSSVFWTKTTESGYLYSSPAVSNNGMVYFASGGGNLYRYSWDGTNFWKRSTYGFSVNKPLVIDDQEILYFTSEWGVYGITKNFFNNSPVIKQAYQFASINSLIGVGPDGTFLFGTLGGKIHAYDRKSNEEMDLKWSFAVQDSLMKASVITENGILYISTSAGDIYILKDIPSEKGVSEWPTHQGNNRRSKVVRIVKQPVSALEESQVTEYGLAQNYPNPFNPSTKIKYQLPESQHVSIRVYDALGNEAAVLVDDQHSAGRYELNFNADHLSSGVYFYQVRAGNYIETRKMVLLK